MTLSDPYLGFKVTTFFEVEYLNIFGSKLLQHTNIITTPNTSNRLVTLTDL